MDPLSIGDYNHCICDSCNWKLSSEYIKSIDKDCKVCSKFNTIWKQYIYGDFKDKYLGKEMNDEVKAEMKEDIISALANLDII
jgi:tRNA G26 N,N-dimethylase Trm1